MSANDHYTWLERLFKIRAALEDNDPPSGGATNSITIIPDSLIGQAGRLCTPSRRSANDPELALVLILLLILWDFSDKTRAKLINPSPFICRIALPANSPQLDLLPAWILAALALALLLTPRQNDHLPTNGTAVDPELFLPPAKGR
ncbi:MAG: hypothetical protein KA772_08410 [Azospira sp.]|nr:hypothetical protein [Azospira sp.]